MNKLIYRKRIPFDNFQLYREADNSGGCDYGYPQDETSIEEWEEVDVYICPHCIKKYKLYNETETTESEIDKIIEEQRTNSCEYNDVTCCIDGCNNIGCFNGLLLAEECSLISEKMEV